MKNSDKYRNNKIDKYINCITMCAIAIRLFFSNYNCSYSVKNCNRDFKKKSNLLCLIVGIVDCRYYNKFVAIISILHIVSFFCTFLCDIQVFHNNLEHNFYKFIFISVHKYINFIKTVIINSFIFGFQMFLTLFAVPCKKVAAL